MSANAAGNLLQANTQVTTNAVQKLSEKTPHIATFAVKVTRQMTHGKPTTLSPVTQHLPWLLPIVLAMQAEVISHLSRFFSRA